MRLSKPNPIRLWCRLFAALIAGGCFTNLSVIGAEGAKTAKSPVAGEVETILREEAAGNVVDRGERLDSLLKSSSGSDALKWQTGYTRWKDRWVKYDELQDDSRVKSKLEAYEKQRHSAADTPTAQLALADWCRSQALANQERVHLMRVLTLQPNNETVRTRLGWKSIGGRWFTKEEIETRRRQSDETARAARDQLAKLKRAFAALDSRNPAERKKGEKTLEQFDDPALIPILLQAFDTVGEDAQVKVIGVIQRFKSPMAGTALARIAVANSYNAVGDAAIQALRSRPFEHYVPTLLSVMSTPVETRFVVDQISSGQLLYRQVFLRETESHKEELFVAHGLQQTSGQVNAGQAKQLYDVGQDRVARVGEVNANIDSVNRSIATVLKAATGQDLPAVPDSWWQWWYSLNESFPSGSKPVYSLASYSATTLPTVVPTLSPLQAPRHECLVAGTPIWTIHGPCPVEKIKTGDLVLAQNTETGELLYKAVVTPTQRPAGPVVRIDTEKGSIRASGGHPFWVSGTGWVRARVLQPGQRLHDVKGTTFIRSVAEENDPVLTYNLIVDDFHSYFVGDGMVLSHDNTIVRPTSATVPGLVTK